ncbi:hypothetical protein V5O48_009398 [Marasmius crinis-equi]|uniref:Uncharacterized protein n=1 Tax=Marasmius crinis-equi TaxID=585013 RepID=A0ABR3FBD1_9AGAR
MGLGLNDTTLVSRDDLYGYEVFSPVSFSNRHELKKRLVVLRRHQYARDSSTTAMSMIESRSEYERGRVYKTLVLDGTDCDRFLFDWDAVSFQRVVNVRIAAFYATSTEGVDPILDVGVAFANRRVIHDGSEILEPAHDATARFKNEARVFDQLQDVEEAVYPLNPAQIDVLDYRTIAERVAHLLTETRCDTHNTTESSLLLLVDDEEKARSLLEGRLGIRVGDMKRGLGDLFRSSPARSSKMPSSVVSARRSESPSRKSVRPHENRDYVYPFVSSKELISSVFTVYVVDVRAMYIAATKMRDDHKWTVPQMAAGSGLKVSADKFWNAAAYAELLIEIFGRLVQGEAIDGRDVLNVERRPQPSLVVPICPSTPPDDFDRSDDDSVEY